jgi:hypothetical protein
MDRLAELIDSAGQNSIMIGDFNLPGVDWETGVARAAERKVVETVHYKLMEQMVAFNTHIKGNTLDLVLNNILNRVTEVRDEGRLGQSDHTMLVIEVSVNAAAPDTTQQRPDWARADWDRAWREEIKGAETAEAWSKFRSKIEEVVRDCVPLKKPRSANRPPWMTTEILRAVRWKKRLWKRDKHKADKTEYKEQEKKTENRKKGSRGDWRTAGRPTRDRSTHMSRTGQRRGSLWAP